jgi:hypothetical protein
MYDSMQDVIPPTSKFQYELIDCIRRFVWLHNSSVDMEMKRNKDLSQLCILFQLEEKRMPILYNSKTLCLQSGTVLLSLHICKE